MSFGWNQHLAETSVLDAHSTDELAVLPLQKTSGLDHDDHQELVLALRQAVVAQSGAAYGTCLTALCLAAQVEAVCLSTFLGDISG